MPVSGIRYIRDTISGGSNINGSAHWVEIQALNASATNVALGKTVTANKAAAGGSLSYVTDGDASASAPYLDLGGGLGQVTVDLGTVTDIASITVFHWTAGSRNYAGLQTDVSVDGSTWVTIYSLSQNGGYTESASGHTLNAPFGSLPAAGGSTDTTPPTVSAATVTNSTPTVVALTASEALASTSTPASAFTVSGHTVQSVAFSGATINLTVTPAFVNGEAARNVTYTQPGTGNVTDVAGNLLANITTLAVTNNVAAAGDTTPPSFVSAQVLNSAPNVIQVTLNETLANSVPPNSAFTPSGGRTVTGVTLNGAIASVTVNTAYAYGDTINIGYTQPGANPRLQDAAGNATASFASQAVTNNIAAPTSASFTFDVCINNTNTLWKNQAAVWEWRKAGRVGSAPTSITYGSGTINSSGVLVATGLPSGAGYGMVAVQNTSASDDNVYYQAGMAA